MSVCIVWIDSRYGWYIDSGKCYNNWLWIHSFMTYFSYSVHASVPSTLCGSGRRTTNYGISNQWQPGVSDTEMQIFLYLCTCVCARLCVCGWKSNLFARSEGVRCWHKKIHPSNLANAYTTHRRHDFVDLKWKNGTNDDGGCVWVVYGLWCYFALIAAKPSTQAVNSCTLADFGTTDVEWTCKLYTHRCIERWTQRILGWRHDEWKRLDGPIYRILRRRWLAWLF